MPTLIDGPAVALADLAKVTKRSVADLERECAELVVYVGVDWANRPAITAHEAHRIVTGKARRESDHDTAWRKYALDAEEWNKRRDEAVRVAAGIASRTATLAFEGPGDAQRKGAEAGREAGRKFEAENPPPLWDGSEQPLTQRRYTDPSLIRRVLDRVSGGVA